MRLLILNPGSSTLKYRFLEHPSGQTIEGGLIDHVAGDALASAAAKVIAKCQPLGIDAVGCRVVHGGDQFTLPTRVTPEVLATIRHLGRLAPLHNPPAVAVLEVLARQLPAVPVVVVFDTAFHATLPERAALYALPLELTRDGGLRRHGFHGTSHRFVSARLIEHLGRTGQPSRVITCHLGNGASLCAVRDGRSIDTSMGLTPLEGLVMGTRCGDVDPGLVLHLIREERRSPEEVDRLLNRQSGLLGLGGHSDMRDLLEAASEGDGPAQLAIDLYCYRIRKYLGAYAAALEGLDAIAFTGGIGEHAPPVREGICRPLAWLGVHLDDDSNQCPGSGEVRISTQDSSVAVWILPTDEERLIAMETAELLGGSS